MLLWYLQPLPAGAKGPATARSAALAPAVSKSSPRSSAAPSLATKSNTATTNAAFPAKRGKQRKYKCLVNH